jgi:hypothetical protein
MNGLVPEGEAQKYALKLSKDCSEFSTGFNDIGTWFDHHILRESQLEKTLKEHQEESRIEALRKALATTHNILSKNQK